MMRRIARWPKTWLFVAVAGLAWRLLGSALPPGPRWRRTFPEPVARLNLNVAAGYVEVLRCAPRNGLTRLALDGGAVRADFDLHIEQGFPPYSLRAAPQPDGRWQVVREGAGQWRGSCTVHLFDPNNGRWDDVLLPTDGVPPHLAGKPVRVMGEGARTVGPTFAFEQKFNPVGPRNQILPISTGVLVKESGTLQPFGYFDDRKWLVYVRRPNRDGGFPGAPRPEPGNEAWPAPPQTSEIVVAPLPGGIPVRRRLREGIFGPERVRISADGRRMALSGIDGGALYDLTANGTFDPIGRYGNLDLAPVGDTMFETETDMGGATLTLTERSQETAAALRKIRLPSRPFWANTAVVQALGHGLVAVQPVDIAPKLPDEWQTWLQGTKNVLGRWYRSMKVRTAIVDFASGKWFAAGGMHFQAALSNDGSMLAIAGETDPLNPWEHELRVYDRPFRPNPWLRVGLAALLGAVPVLFNLFLTKATQRLWRSRS